MFNQISGAIGVVFATNYINQHIIARCAVAIIVLYASNGVSGWLLWKSVEYKRVFGDVVVRCITCPVRYNDVPRWCTC